MLWHLAAPIIVLPMIYGVLSMISALRGLSSKVWISPPGSVLASLASRSLLPRLLVVVPLYKEREQDVRLTFESIAKQRYPAERVRVLVVLEAGDQETSTAVSRNIHILRSVFPVEVVVNGGGRRGKAAAINYALMGRLDDFDVVLILDGGDRVDDELFFLKVSYMIQSGASVVGCKVYRWSSTLLGRLSYVDTYLWYNVALPAFAWITGAPLVSGEGMAVSTEFLKEIGGFPEKLAEDAYLSIAASLRGRRVSLLDVVVWEGAPATLRSLIKQRMRWYRGHLECLSEVFRWRSQSGNTARLLVVVLQPVILLLLPIPFVVTAVHHLLNVEVPAYIMAMAYLEAFSLIAAPAYIVYRWKELRESSTLLAPLYWILQSFIVLASVVAPSVPWFKTVRSSEELANRVEVNTIGALR